MGGGRGGGGRDWERDRERDRDRPPFRGGDRTPRGGGGGGGGGGPFGANEPKPDLKVDREKTCPLLLRVFTKLNGHHEKEEFAEHGKEPVGDEVQIYTWKDATLKELTELIRGVRPAARRSPAKLSFAFVYPDRTGKNVVKPVGSTFTQRSGPDDRKTLHELKFESGDFLDVAMYVD